MLEYNQDWNSHYDFANPANGAEIEKMARYDDAFAVVYRGAAGDMASAKEFLQICERAALGGKDGYDLGVVVNSEWGINKIVDVRKEKGEDICIKEITVFANNMLSLQSHNGRREEWEVQNGKLSLIMNGDLYDVSDEGVFCVTGNKNERIADPGMAMKNGNHWTMILPPGSAHCMINRGDNDVTVIETQRGICREADNKRFADQQRAKPAPRATLPLTSENLYKSACLYWDIESRIAAKPGLNWTVSNPSFQKTAT